MLYDSRIPYNLKNLIQYKLVLKILIKFYLFYR